MKGTVTGPVADVTGLRKSHLVTYLPTSYVLTYLLTRSLLLTHFVEHSPS